MDIVRRLRGVGDKKCVDRVMNKLKLEEYASRKARHISLGNAQRLGIAKAIIHQPMVLILDEPTNGLDPEGIVEVRGLLQDLAGNYGVTILVSSHKLDEISRIATNIAIIHHCRLVKKMDDRQLENELKKSLVLDGKDRAAMISILSKAGYMVENADQRLPEKLSALRIQNRDAVRNPEKVVTLLVNAGYPPNLLKVEKEDLEAYFIRTIQEWG